MSKKKVTVGLGRGSVYVPVSQPTATRIARVDRISFFDSTRLAVRSKSNSTAIRISTRTVSEGD